MHLLIENMNAKVLSSTTEEEQFLDNILAVDMPGYRFTPSFKSGRWDGKKHFYSLMTKKFPVGFLPMVVQDFQKHGFLITVYDTRTIKALGDSTSIRTRYPGLRDYQYMAIEAAIGHYLSVGKQTLFWPRGVVKMPPGSGKTRTAGAIIDFISQKTLYIVERKELMYQTQKELANHTKMSIGLLGDNHADFACTITVAMMQTLDHGLHDLNRFVQKMKNDPTKDLNSKDSQQTIAILRNKEQQFRKFLESIQTLIVDECHHQSKGAYHNIALKCGAVYRFGFSGSPLTRGDLGDVYLIGDTGDIIVDQERCEIEQQGFLSKVKIYVFQVNQPKNFGLRFQVAYDHLIVNNIERNQLIVQAVKHLLAHRKEILVLVRIVKHGQLLQTLLKQAKIPSIFISGKDKMGGDNGRKQVLENFGKTFKVLIASTILDEGVDLTEISGMVFAGAGKSQIKTVQRVGRGSRIKQKGPNVVHIVDFLDNTNKYLLNHAQRRIESYEGEHFEIHYPEKV